MQLFDFRAIEMKTSILFGINIHVLYFTDVVEDLQKRFFERIVTLSMLISKDILNAMVCKIAALRVFPLVDETNLEFVLGS